MANTTHAGAGEHIKILHDNEGPWVKVGSVYKVVEVLEYEDRPDGCDDRCFRLFDNSGNEVSETWWGCPSHYEILSNTESLLKEAARRYPSGTHYLNISDGYFGAMYNTVNPEPFIFDYYKSDPRIAVEYGAGFVYQDGVWAPIVHPTYQSFQRDDIVVRWRDIEESEWKGIGDIPCPPIGSKVKIINVHIGTGLDKLPSIEIDNRGWYPATAFVFSEYYNQSITNRGTAALNTEDHVKSKISTGISIEVQRPIASIITGQRRTGSGVQGRRDAAVIGRGHLSYKTITGK